MKINTTIIIGLIVVLFGIVHTAKGSLHNRPSAAEDVCPHQCTVCAKNEILCSGSNITEILNYGLIFFQVQHLDLSNTSMDSIPPIISTMFHCKTLNLSINNIQEIPTTIFRNLWNLEILILSNNSIKDITLINPKELISNNKNIKVLDLSYNPIENFGQNLKSVFYSESLEVLDISNCKITSLAEPFILSGLTKLSYLNLSNNPLTHLNGVYSNTLSILNLKGCQLSFLDNNSLSGFKSLEVLDVSYNDQLNSEDGIHSTKIATVDFSMCSIIEPKLQGMTELKSAFLNGNRIKKLEAFQFFNNSKVITLDLSGNHVTFVHKLAFHGMSSLVYLDLSSNRITHVDWDVTFATLRSLETLNLSQNPIADFGPLRSTTLRRLNLSHCRIDSLPNATLNGLDQLAELVLSNNPLQTLQPGSLNSTRLSVLDLSYCRLSHLTWSEFTGAPDLTELKLTGNRLVTLKNGTFNRCPKLKRVYLDDNPWRCDCYSGHFAYMARLANSTLSKQQGDSRNPRCLTPDNVTGLPWYVACANGPAYSRDNRKNFSMAVGVILILCVSGLMAICVAVHENVKTRQAMRRRRQLDGEFGGDRDRRNGGGGGGGGGEYYDEYAAAAESLRKLSQLPSYDEAIMLPRLSEPQRMAKRNSCTQTEGRTPDETPLTGVSAALATASAVDEAAADEAVTWPLRGDRFLSPASAAAAATAAGFRVTRL